MRARTIAAGRVGRLRLPRRLVMPLLSLLMLVGPLYHISLESARAQTPPPAEICVTGPDGKGGFAAVGDPSRVVQGCDLRRAGMAELERQAIDDLLKMHQLPAADAAKIVAWERDTVRALLFAKLVDMITKDPAERTAIEQAIVDEMAEIVRGRRIAAAQYSINQYNQWAFNPCGYEEPIDTDYEIDLPWCSGNPLVVNFRGPIPPTLENFLTYGQAYIYEDFQDDGPAFWPASATAVAIGLVAAGIAGGAGAVIGASLTVSSALIAAIHPFLAAAVAGSHSAAAISAVAGASAGGVGAASVGAVFATVVIAVVLVIIRTIQVAAEAEIPVKLNEALTEAQAGVDLRQLVQSKEGKAEIFAAYLIETLPNEGNQLTAGASDRTFILTDAGGNETRSQTLNYQCWNPHHCRTDVNHTARLSGGWFVTSNPGTGTERMTLSIDYIDWNGDGWTASRVGPREFLHTRTKDDSAASAGEPAEPFTSNEIRFTAWDGSLVIASINQPPTTPGTPDVAEHEEINNGGFAIAWNVSTDGDGDPITYTLQRCDPDAAVPTLDGGTTNPSCTTIASDIPFNLWEFFTSPQPQGEWTYRVQATDGYDASAFSAESEVIMVDQTAPQITFASRAPMPNPEGWNNSDVTATWNCVDLLSLVVPVSGVVAASVSETVSTEGANQTVTGTCQDKAGNSVTNTVTGISIDMTAPAADPGGPYTVEEGSSVQLDGGGSSDALSGVASLDWDSNGGGQFSSADPATFNGVDGPATSTVQLQVTDKAGNVSTASTTVTITNVAPTATFTAPATVNEGSAIALALTGPFDPSSADMQAGFSYAFDCGDGNGYRSFTTNASASCPASDDGTRTVKGKIRDKDGGETEYSATVVVANVAPTVTLGEDVEINEGDVFTGSGSFSDPGSNDTHDATVNYGDGSGVQTLPFNPDGTFALNHAYHADDGQYTVEVCVTEVNDAQSSDCDDLQVTVLNVAPTITDISVAVSGNRARITVIATDPAGVNDPLSYSFDCGNDGVYEVGPQPESTATCPLGTAEGAFTIGVQVSDGDGGITDGLAEVIRPTELCANDYTGVLRYDASCRSHESAITLPDDGPVTVCANRSTKLLRYSARGNCTQHETRYVLPEDGPLSVCINRYTQVMRVVNTLGQCASHETGRVIAATEVGELPPPRSR